MSSTGLAALDVSPEIDHNMAGLSPKRPARFEYLMAHFNNLATMFLSRLPASAVEPGAESNWSDRVGTD